MIRLAARNTPVDAAWAAFDEAAIGLSRLYRMADATTETAAAREDRMKRCAEVVRLWDAWRALFLSDEPEDAA